MPAGRGQEGDMRGGAKASFRSRPSVEIIGSQADVPPTLVTATPLDVARLTRPGIDARAVMGAFSFDGHDSPHGSLKTPEATMLAGSSGAADLSLRSVRSRKEAGIKAPFLLPQEYARLQPELRKGREQFYKDVNGERQIDFDHPDIASARQYGNEVLDGSRIVEGGRLTGLRVRASVRNKDNPDMLDMGKMSIQELVANTKKNKTIHLKPGTNELLLPKDFPKATAGVDQWGEALFYHDAPLLIEGILKSDIDDKVEYAKGVVENLVYELYLFGMIPNASSLQMITRSQPPSLTRMAWRVHDSMMESGYDRDKAQSWLGTVMEAAEFEFNNYWKNKKKYHHYVEDSNLVTPGDIDVGSHDLAERETGFDMTPEYNDRAHDHLDPNINGELVGYAWDIAQYKRMIGDKEGAKEWDSIGDTMAEEMRERMYDGKIFRAVDIRKTGKMSEVMSQSGYRTLALGIPTTDQANTMEAELDKFIGPYGVAHIVPDTVPLSPEKAMLEGFSAGMQPTIINHFESRQWGGANDKKRKKNITEWPIETHALIKGLRRYGHFDRAIGIAEDWLLGYTEYFNQHGTLPEKRNVLTGANGQGVEYAQQTDFGWSIANYLWVLEELSSLYELRQRWGEKASFSRTEPLDVFVANHHQPSVAETV